MAKKMDSISKTGTEAANDKGTTEQKPTVTTVEPKKDTAAEPVNKEPAAAEPAKAPEKPSTEEKTNPVSEPLSEKVTENGQESPKDSYDTLFPEPSVAISSPPTWIWWLLLAVASVFVAALGFQLASGRLDHWLSVSEKPSPSASPSPSATPTPSPTESSTPTPSPSVTPSATPTAASALKPSEVTLRILNGTTVTGAASTAKSTLEKAGYTVKSIGNAKQRTYQSTVIYYASGHQAEAQAVQDALPKYQSSLQESSLASPDMVLVVIGAK